MTLSDEERDNVVLDDVLKGCRDIVASDHPPTFDDAIRSRQAALAVLAKYRRETEEAAERRGIEFGATVLAEQVEHYPEDIFTPPPAPKDLTDEQRTLVSQASAAMARFICGRWPDIIRERFAERNKEQEPRDDADER